MPKKIQINQLKDAFIGEEGRLFKQILNDKIQTNRTINSLSAAVYSVDGSKIITVLNDLFSDSFYFDVNPIYLCESSDSHIKCYHK